MNHWLNKSLNRIERIGNKLPDPVSLFVIAIGLVFLGSWVAALTDLSAIHPVDGRAIGVVSLFDAEVVQRLFVEMPKTFSNFAPLGLVLLVMLGIGVADKSGLIRSTLKLLIAKIPNKFLSLAVVFAGIMSSLAADTGYVVLIPLSAIIFLAGGRHPLAGLAASFAGVSAGFSANLILTSIDPLLAGLTEASAQLVDSEYTVFATANYYLMVALVPVLTVAGAWLTDYVVEPRLQQYKIKQTQETVDGVVNSNERRAIYITALVLLLMLCLISLLAVPQDAILRDQNGTLAPFYKSIVCLLFIVFLMCGLVYGCLTKVIRSDRDVVNMMAEAMADMGHYIVLAFFAAHLIVLFKWSNLGLIIAIEGASSLQAIGLTGPFLIVAFIVVSSVINLFIGSASAKWALIAPVFVPMMMLLGYSPELTQAAYRIGDSVTNILTPLMPYFPLVIIFARKYVPKLGIGTLVTMMLPYSIVYGALSTIVLMVWMWLNLPLGPGI